MADPQTQVIQVPFAGGMNQKTQSEWLDPSQNQAQIINGQFAKQGGISKRYGLQAATSVDGYQPGSPYVSPPVQPVRALGWSQGIGGVYTSPSQGGAALYTVSGDELSGMGPVPGCSTVRRGIPAVTADSNTYVPVIVDDPNFRWVFYIQGVQVWCVILSLLDGSVAHVPFVAWSPGGSGPQVAPNVITPICTICTDGSAPFGSGPYISVLLQFKATESLGAYLVGLSLNQINGLTTTTFVDGAGFEPGGGGSGYQTNAADITPFVGDPTGGFIVFLEYGKGAVPAGNLTWYYYRPSPSWSLVTSNPSPWDDYALAAMCTVYALHTDSGTGQPGSIAFLWTYQTGSDPNTYTIDYALLSGDGSFTTIVAPESIATPSARPYLASLCPYGENTGQAYLVAWYLVAGPPASATSNTGWTTPGGTGSVYGTVSAAGAYTGIGLWPLGCMPVGKAFVIPPVTGDTWICYQPVVLQLGIYASDEVLPSSAALTSEQCTLYLLQFASVGVATLPVSSVAVRQIDPTFSYNFFLYPTASLPCSTFLIDGTSPYVYDACLGLRTIGQDVPGIGASSGASWLVQWGFGLSNVQLQYQYNEVAGALRLAGSIPFVCDGTQTFEDSFFYYPEFAYVGLTDAGTWANTTGTYNYAVCYAYTDATGQLQRSVPVFCENPDGATSITATHTEDAPTIFFPPMGLSYRNLLRTGAVYAEVYRTTSGGSVYYLLATCPAYPDTSAGSTVGSLQITYGGTGYTSAPTVTIGGGGGTGATATATVGTTGHVSSVTLQNPQIIPGGTVTVSFSGGGGSGASAIVLTTIGPDPDSQIVTGVSMTHGGSGYTSPPTVTFHCPPGTLTFPVGTAVLAGYEQLIKLTLTAPGSGFTTNPSVAISGGGGAGATAVAFLAPPTSTDVYVSYVDDGSVSANDDATLATASVLYTTGDPGPVDAPNPPAASMQCVHWNRLWIVDETLQNIWFSSQFASGSAPVFNEAFFISFPDGGDITGIAGMDDKLIVFKLNGIYVIYGQGPAENAQGSDITQPQPLATDSGAVDWRGVCLFPGGLFFQSRTGLYVLDRQLGVTWTGKAVVDTLAQYPIVLEATLVPNLTQVRFLCTNAGGSQVVLVYDYLESAWTTFTYPSPIYSTAYVTEALPGSGVPYYGAPISETGVYVGLGYQLMVEANPSTSSVPYADEFYGGVSFVSTSVTSAPFKIQGVQGYQMLRSVQLLAEAGSPVGISMSLAVNGASAIVQTATWIEPVVSSLPIPQVSMRIAGPYCKQQSITVTVQDLPPATFPNSGSDTGQGATFVGFAVELQRIGDRFSRLSYQAKA